MRLERIRYREEESEACVIFCDVPRYEIKTKIISDRSCREHTEEFSRPYSTGYGPGYVSRYSDELRAGWSGDRIPVGGEIFRTRPDQPWGPPSLVYNGYRVIPGGNEAGAFTTHPI